MKLLDIVDKHLKRLNDKTSLDRVVDVIASIINDAYEIGGYVGINIMGAQGTGKTTLAMYILHRIYGDWDIVVDFYTFFDIRDFLRVAEELLITGERYKAVIFDDFGLWASKWRRTVDVANLLEFMNVIRTIVSAGIYTYVDTSAQKFIRENARIVIMLERIDKEKVNARVYRRKATIKGIVYKKVAYFRFKPSKLFEDEGFRNAYSKYWEKRREVVRERLNKLLEKIITY